MEELLQHFTTWSEKTNELLVLAEKYCTSLIDQQRIATIRILMHRHTMYDSIVYTTDEYRLISELLDHLAATISYQQFAEEEAQNTSDEHTRGQMW